MELVVIELLLWAGLVFFFWALKDGLSQVEPDLEEFGAKADAARNAAGGLPHYDQAERVHELIGRYLDTPIYQYAMIGGQYYRFDRVCPAGTGASAQENERCLAPGLIYAPVAQNERLAF